MRVALPALVVLALIVGTTTARPVAQQANVRIRVVSAADNEPIRRAHVAIATTPDTIRLLTDEDGGVNIPALPASAPIMISRVGFLSLKTDGAALGRSGFVTRLTRAAVIEGRIVSPSGRSGGAMGVEISPIGGAQRQASNDAQSFAVFSNDLGEFRAFGLSEGRYRLHAYLDFGERDRVQLGDPPGLVIPSRTVGVAEPRSDVVDVDLHAGEQAELTLTLGADNPSSIDPRSQSAITGVVTDQSGDPVEGAVVRLWHPTGMSRQLQLTGRVMRTDDRGRYRLFGVSAGAYFVEARANGPSVASGDTISSTYYPEASVIGEARTVRVNGTGDVSGIDILTRPRHLARVTGVVLASSNLTGGDATLVHDPVEGSVRLPSMTTRLDRSGAFTFDQVPPGNYLLRVVASMPLLDHRAGNAPEAAVRAISIGDDDPPPIRITTSPTPVLRGRVVVDGGSEPLPDGLSVGYMAPGAGANAVSAGMWIDGSGTFSIVGLTGPVFLRLSGPAPGWWVKSIHTPMAQSPFEPITVTEDEVTIVIAHSAATVSGRVLAPAGASGDADITLIVFPADVRRWDWARLTPLAPDRQFKLESLRPGEYYVVALAHATEHPDWDDMPALLRALSSVARRVTLSEGQRLGVDVRVTDALR
jgi:hypothetical protein